MRLPLSPAGAFQIPGLTTVLRSAASHTKYYPRNGKKPELIVNKQFARDAPSILRINGQEPSGEVSGCTLEAWVQIFEVGFLVLPVNT